jgi:hypothetical protein
MRKIPAGAAATQRSAPSAFAEQVKVAFAAASPGSAAADPGPTIPLATTEVTTATAPMIGSRT